MIARCQYPTASLMEARDAFAVCLAQTIAGINRKQPELINIRLVENTQHVIVAFRIRFAIARRDFVITERGEMITQQRKSIDVPVVFDVWNRGLQ